MLASRCARSSMWQDTPSYTRGLHNTAVAFWLCLTAYRLFFFSPPLPNLMPLLLLILPDGKTNIKPTWLASQGKKEGLGWKMIKIAAHWIIVVESKKKNKTESTEMCSSTNSEQMMIMWGIGGVGCVCVCVWRWHRLTAPSHNMSLIKRFHHTHSSDNGDTSRQRHSHTHKHSYTLTHTHTSATHRV